MNKMDRRETAKRYLAALQSDRTDRRKGKVTALQRLARAALPAEKPRPAVGQVWRVEGADPDDQPVLVVVMETRLATKALLAHDETWLAAEDDLVVPPRESPTREELVVCLWRPLEPREEHFAALVGSIGDGAWSALDALEVGRRTCRLALTAQGARELRDGALAVAWVATRDGRPDLRFQTGPRIVEEDDPRIAVREELARCTAYLGQVRQSQPEPDILTRWLERARESLLGQRGVRSVPAAGGLGVAALVTTIGGLVVPAGAVHGALLPSGAARGSGAPLASGIVEVDAELGAQPVKLRLTRNASGVTALVRSEGHPLSLALHARRARRLRKLGTARSDPSGRCAVGPCELRDGEALVLALRAKGARRRFIIPA